MKVLVSACLLGERCKYNGGSNESQKLKELLAGHKVVMVCPEVMGGLLTPRVPVELRDGAAINRDGVNVDQAFRMGAQKALECAQREKISLAVLQSRSPSCGVGRIYDGSFSGRLIEGNGIFAERLLQEGFCVKDIREVEENGLGDCNDE